MSKKSAIERIQSIGLTKPYKGFAHLAPGYHEIERFRMTKNKFAKGESDAKTILCDLKDEVVFLPNYFLQQFDEEDLASLNSSEETMYLYFGGNREGKKTWIIRVVSETQKKKEEEKAVDDVVDLTTKNEDKKNDSTQKKREMDSVSENDQNKTVIDTDEAQLVDSTIQNGNDSTQKKQKIDSEVTDSEVIDQEFNSQDPSRNLHTAYEEKNQNA